MNRIALLAALVLTPLTAIAASAQRTVEPKGPNFHKIAAIDSGSIQFASVSPNGKWVAIGIDGTSIWIAPTDGHTKPVQLLTGPHKDRAPLWFISSNGLTFTSNRPSRGGPDKFYAMSIAIDPATGRAVGAPRTVSTEEVSSAGYRSPDGSWIAYSTSNQDSVMIVPATGGTARLVTAMKFLVGPPMFREDGKAIVFSTITGPTQTWYEVPVSGGAPKKIHGPYFGDLHLHAIGVTNQTASRLELRDTTDRLVSAIDVPKGMNLRLFNYTHAALGFMTKSVYTTHVVDVRTGAHHDILNAPAAWVDGWANAPSGMLADGFDAGRVFVAALDSAGRTSHRIDLPADARDAGWDGADQSVLSYRLGTPPLIRRGIPSPLYAADVATGTTRMIFPRAYESGAVANSNINLSGPGGDEALDNSLLAAVPGKDSVEIRSAGMDGVSVLHRAFSNTDTLTAVAVNQDRVAWTKRKGDSIIVFAARGVNGSAHRIAAIQREPFGYSSPIELAWSRRGDRLAINNGGNRPVSVLIATIRDDGSTDQPLQQVAIAAKGAWSMRWVGDDRELAMIAYTSDRGQVYLIPTNAPESARIVSGDDDAEETLKVSRDGMHLMYPSDREAGSTIWRVEFVKK